MLMTRLLIEQRRNRAKEKDIPPIDLSAAFSKEFLKGMTNLNCYLLPINHMHVSHHIQQIIEMITKTENKGCAYRVKGDVYFSVDKYSPNYGRSEDNRSGERVAVDSRKRTKFMLI